MKAWLQTQGRLLLEALQRLVRHPLSSLLNIVVLATAMALPTSGYLLLANLESFLGHAGVEPEMSLLLVTEASPLDRKEIEKALGERAEIIDFRLLTRDQALADMQRRAGLADLLEGLPRNPLPDAYVLRIGSAEPASIAQLADELGKWPKIAKVVYDADWTQRVQAGIAAGQLLVFTLGLMLAVAMLAISFNTIRMQVLTHSAEIAVAAILGATPGFLRRPFLYFGALQGAIAGLLAWIILALALAALHGRLALLLGEMSMTGQPVQLSFVDGLCIVLFSAGLGWAGAWLSAKRYAGS